MSSTAWPSERPLSAFRIGSRSHPLLDGGGAAATDGARWNGRGRWIVYAAEHYATALLERAVQLNALKFPRTLVWTTIHVAAGALVEEVTSSAVSGWEADDKQASQAFGNRWYDEQRSLVLIVPALVAPGLERNLLINQRHPQFELVTASPAEAVRCHPRLLV